MRVAIPEMPDNPTPKLREILTRMRERGEDLGESDPNPRPFTRQGAYTKDFFRMQLAEARSQLADFEARQLVGAGPILTSLREQIASAEKALQTAPDRPGLFEIFV